MGAEVKEPINHKRGDSIRAKVVFGINTSAHTVTSQLRNTTQTTMLPAEVFEVDALTGEYDILIRDTTTLKVGVIYQLDVEIELNGIRDSSDTLQYQIVQDITYV
jgi:hypothetical protein